MLQAIVRKGKVLGEEIPAPVVSKGSVLIKVVASCISAGTELSGVQVSGESLIKKVLSQPEKVVKAFNMLRAEGFTQTSQKIAGIRNAETPTGYSLAGVVIGVGDGVTGFHLGDAVAAAGAGVANHAEYVDVPENLVLKMPSEMDFKLASTVALGSIAMQGVRRADLKLGEFGVVFGAGILGLLSVQMLRLSGIRVVAVDLDDARLAIAGELGAERTVNVGVEDSAEVVKAFTGGHGADAVLFTAATSNSEPLSQSFRMCKRRGRVILVGVAGLNIKREDMYARELDFLVSTSYGPGRYDRAYEEKGYDYPYAYVRWTENRNMGEYLRLVHAEDIVLDKLISSVYPIEKVSQAFQSLEEPGSRPLMVVLDYGEPDFAKLADYRTHKRKLIIKPRSLQRGVINVAVVGVGGFATGMHLPNLQRLSSRYQLHTVMDIVGHKAKAIAGQYDAQFTTTDYFDILADETVNLVMICTRHDSHADLTLKALRAGKNVFVEKPLAINRAELDNITAFYADDSGSDKPLLMVGFNRRFSRYAYEIRKHTENRINPLVVFYRMNAGLVPLDHWVHEYGGRIVGEACHIVDLMSFLTGSRIASVSYESLVPGNDLISSRDNKSIVLKYEDGSICTIEYFAVGSKELPKEYMEVHFDGKSIILDDYRSLKGYGINLKEITSTTSEKGHFEELELLHDSLTGKMDRWPIELWDLLQTTEICLELA